MDFVDTFDYQSYGISRPDWIKRKAEEAGRFVSMTDRKDTSELPPKLIKNIEPGKFITNWRGVGMCTDPLDLAIYQSMLWDIRPATIIEIGALEGGTAVWLADLVKLFGIACRVYSFDRDLSLLSQAARERKDVTFLQGDCFHIEKTFTPEIMENLPHPWLIIEDAHVNLIPVLEHFYSFMKTGDYLVVEDGQPSLIHDNNVLLDRNAEPTCWGPWKLNAIRAFVERHPAELKIDTFYNDRFGYNVTWNMNGYLRRM